MESHGFPSAIHVSRPTFEALAKQTVYEFVEVGYMPIKGRGQMKTYLAKVRHCWVMLHAGETGST
jgi:Adenylate and Guanylate cyclase catalytic domain